MYLFYEYDLNKKTLMVILKTINKISTEKIYSFFKKIGLKNINGTVIKNNFFYDYLFTFSEIEINKIYDLYFLYKKKSEVTYEIYNNEGNELLTNYFKELKEIYLNRNNIPLLILRFKRNNNKILSIKFYNIEFVFDNKNDYKGGINNAYSF